MGTDDLFIGLLISQTERIASGMYKRPSARLPLFVFSLVAPIRSTLRENGGDGRSLIER